jgi:hypothetical protein
VVDGGISRFITALCHVRWDKHLDYECVILYDFTSFSLITCAVIIY